MSEQEKYNNVDKTIEFNPATYSDSPFSAVNNSDHPLSPLSSQDPIPAVPVLDGSDKDTIASIKNRMKKLGTGEREAIWAYHRDTRVVDTQNRVFEITVDKNVVDTDGIRGVKRFIENAIRNKVMEDCEDRTGDLMVDVKIDNYSFSKDPDLTVTDHDVKEVTRWFCVYTRVESEEIPDLDWSAGHSTPEKALASAPITHLFDSRELVSMTRRVKNQEVTGFTHDPVFEVNARVVVKVKEWDIKYGHLVYSGS